MYGSTAPPLEKSGAERLTVLRGAEIAFSDPKLSLEMMARFAAEACGVPIGAVHSVDTDRQWTLACSGTLDARAFEAGSALRRHAEASGSALAAIPATDLEAPLRFGACVPLRTKSGYALGALYVFDCKPNALTNGQRADLVRIGAFVAEVVAMRFVVREALRRKLRALSEAIEHTGTPLVILESAGADAFPTCTYANVAFDRQFGFADGAVIGHSPIGLMAGPRTEARTIASLAHPANRTTPFQTEIVLYGGDGAAHDVVLHRRPVPSDDGSVTSWVVSLQDVTAQRAAAADLAKQAERMRALYAITSMRGLTGYAQVDTVIKLGLACLGLDYGFLVQIEGDRVTTLNAIGERKLSEPGNVASLRTTWGREAILSNDVRSYDDLGDPAQRPFGAHRLDGWGAYVLSPVSIGDEVFGAIGFMGREPRATPFTDADREFVRLIGSFVGSAVERKLQKEKLDALAFFDTLTGLCNRAMLFQHLEAACEKAQRDGSRLALHYIDLDGFKAVNDTAGHAAGDHVLKGVANRLRANVRNGDVVARIGGDEFVIVQTVIDAPGDVDALAQRLIDAVRSPFALGDRTFQIGASMGIASYAEGTESVNDLLNAADRALYHAKARAKGSAYTAVA